MKTNELMVLKHLTTKQGNPSEMFAEIKNELPCISQKISKSAC